MNTGVTRIERRITAGLKMIGTRYDKSGGVTLTFSDPLLGQQVSDYLDRDKVEELIRDLGLLINSTVVIKSI